MIALDRLEAVSPAETLGGQPGVVDLWWCSPESEPEAGPVLAHETILSADERVQSERYHRESDRSAFRATRALVRTVLSRYADVEPGEWRFVRDGRGRPRIAGPELAQRLHFNLSNTAGLAVCVVSVAHPMLGVDVEDVDRPDDVTRIVARCFSSREARALEALSRPEQRARILSSWTLKESYAKARRLGLALPFHQASFHLDHDDRVDAAFDPRLGDDASRWRFTLARASRRHVVAVAVETGEATLSLRASPVVPLQPYRLHRPAATRGRGGRTS